jgi:transcriptional regulator with XRE-family HTH domain
MKTKVTEFEVAVPNADGTGIAERVMVKIPLEWDEELKEWLLTAEAHQIIEDTKARLLGLILPEQMKELRQRLGYTQKQMGELFQVGEKSWTRWESGKHRPSRSISLLIQALYDNELNLAYLQTKSGFKSRSLAQNTVPNHWKTVSAKGWRTQIHAQIFRTKTKCGEGFGRTAKLERQKVVVSFSHPNVEKQKLKDEDIAIAA